MKTVRKSLAVTIACTLVATGGAASGSSADSGEAVNIGGAESQPVLPVHSEDEADRLLAGQIAKESGRTVDEEFASLRAQERFTRAVSDLEAAYPDSFSSARWLNSGPSEVVLISGVSRDIEEEARKLLGRDVTLRTDGGFSRGQIESEVSSLGRYVFERRRDVPFKVTPDAETGEIFVTSARSVGAEIAAWQASTSEARGKRPVVAQRVDSRQQIRGAAMVGGAQLNYEGSASGCTSGFPVRTTDGVFGLSTADHCGGRLNYGNSRWLAWNPIKAGRSQRLDLEVLATLSQSSFPVNYQFQYQPHALREVTWAASPVKGATYCRYGRVTFSHCDTILSTGVSGPITTNGVTTWYEHMVETQPTSTRIKEGDSGGPVFSGGTAVASITGYTPVINTSFFTDIMRIADLQTSIYRKR